MSESQTRPFLGSISPVAPDPEGTCLTRLFAPQLRTQCRAERDALFCVAKTPYDARDATHAALMRTLYRQLTGSAALGSWQAIGFQRDADFVTDLRGAGMLGPLQALYLVEQRPWLARSMFAAAQDPVTGFPFMVQSISLTARALQALRIGALTPLCNARAAGEAGAAAGAAGPVQRALDDFYAGLALSFVTAWRESGATIARMGHVMQEVGVAANRQPERCVAKLHEAHAKAAAAAAAAARRSAAGGGGDGGEGAISFSRF